MRSEASCGNPHWAEIVCGLAGIGPAQFYGNAWKRLLANGQLSGRTPLGPNPHEILEAFHFTGLEPDSALPLLPGL